MRKNLIASVAIVGALALGGCSSGTPATETKTAVQTAPAPAPTPAPAAEVVTADTISAKLTAAEVKFTTKDKTTAAKTMKNGAVITKSTEFNIPVSEGTDKVVLTVNEISDATQKVAVESDIRMSFIAATEADANIKAVMAKMNSDTTLVGVIYKKANEKDAWKIMDAIDAE